MIYLPLINPATNFFDLTAGGEIFQIFTYALDLKRDFPDIIAQNYDDSSVQAMITKVFDPSNSKGVETYTYGMDQYAGNKLVPKMKCNSPCYTCLSADPDFCLSCWSSTGDLSFLQPGSGSATQTCKKHCDDGYSTNGNNNVKNSDGAKINESKSSKKTLI